MYSAAIVWVPDQAERIENAVIFYVITINVLLLDDNRFTLEFTAVSRDVSKLAVRFGDVDKRCGLGVKAFKKRLLVEIVILERWFRRKAKPPGNCSATRVLTQSRALMRIA